MSEAEQNLLIDCPVCAEELEVPGEEWVTFSVGDVLVCEGCGAELEVTRLEPPEFELLGLLTACPSCGAEIELSEEELEEGRKVVCPSCHTKFTLEFDDLDLERPQA